MSRNVAMIIGFIVIALIIVVGTALYKNQSVSKLNEEREQTMNVKKILEEGTSGSTGTSGEDIASTSSGASDDTSVYSNFTGVKLVKGDSPYFEYSKDDFEKALSMGKVVFLDFYADWDPSSRKENRELASGFTELANDNFVGFRINYEDSYTDQDERNMTNAYNINHQNVKIILKNGKEVIRDQVMWSKAKFTKEMFLALQQ